MDGTGRVRAAWSDLTLQCEFASSARSAGRPPPKGKKVKVELVSSFQAAAGEDLPSSSLFFLITDSCRSS